jgi:hypothetical protein
MAKKTLLEGRKRSSELAANYSVAQKKEELLKLQSETQVEVKGQQALPLESATPTTETLKPVVTSHPLTIEKPLPQAAVAQPVAKTVTPPMPKPATPPYVPAKPAVVNSRPVVSASKPAASTSTYPKAPTAPRAAHFNPIEDANLVAQQLQQIYFQLEQAGSANRHAYSRQARYDYLVQEIKKFVQQKARAYQLQGMSEEANLDACQKLIDHIRAVLQKVGIHLNPLQLKNPKKRR